MKNDILDDNFQIESIELNINDNLIMYLSNGGEPSPDGEGSLPYFISVYWLVQQIVLPYQMHFDSL